MDDARIKELLDAAFERYHAPDFIPNDPISIPHRFSAQADIEIMGFFAAVLAWGQRVTIINNCNKLLDLMDGAPHDFIRNHSEVDRKRFLGFVHRTFNDTDLLYFIEWLQWWYAQNDSLESAFTQHMSDSDETVEKALVGFHHLFFSLPDFPPRTRKHIANPERKSTCKRLNMFLRWMVRPADGVDFGIWKGLRTDQLLCPLDVHVERVARELGLIQRKQRDWQTVLELTANLRKFNSEDPVRYDFALFGISAVGEP